MIGHCIICGKAYKYWEWFGYHYDKIHPEYNNPWGKNGFPLTIRVKEVGDAMHKEALMFANSPRLSWI